jgi:hypothetical protein
MDFLDEPVERRAALRGPTRGLSIILDRELDAVEASRRTFFVAVDDPERYRLADRFDGRIARAGRAARARLEVIRVERRGLALCIVDIDDAAALALREILGPLSEPEGAPPPA